MKYPTHFYPVVLRPTIAKELDESVGRLSETELRELRRLVGPALGFNSGNCFARGAATGSRRGVIAVVDEKRALLSGTPYAVVMTSHPYSAKKEGFLAVIPLLLDCEPEEGQDVLLEHVMTFGELDPEAESAVMLVTSIYSLRTERHVTRFTSLVVPSPQLLKAEAILKQWLDT